RTLLLLLASQQSEPRFSLEAAPLWVSCLEIRNLVRRLRPRSVRFSGWYFWRGIDAFAVALCEMRQADSGRSCGASICHRATAVVGRAGWQGSAMVLGRGGGCVSVGHFRWSHRAKTEG